MPWPLASPSGSIPGSSRAGAQCFRLGSALRSNNPTLSQPSTHSVVITYDGCTTDLAAPFRGTYEDCVRFIAGHIAPAACAFDIKSAATGRLVSYRAGH